MRDHVLFDCGLTQAETDQSPVREDVTLFGRVIQSPLPLSATALPILPGTRVVAWPPGVLTGPVAHRLSRSDCLTVPAMPFSSSALAWSPRIWYSCAAALASEYWNDDSVRSCG